MKYSENTYAKALNALAALRATLPEKEWPTVDFVAAAICEKADRDSQPDHIGDVTAMVAQPDNGPLTLAELRGMDDPVWCACDTFDGKGGFWCLCSAGIITPPSLMSFYAAERPDWVFYRRKREPEGA
ncbi:MAG TPA: hypothetical protein VN421_09560 [Pseudoflavonifractor sp.]|nr:hypothetical protein [Pseudoflavonifractor sp.]